MTLKPENLNGLILAGGFSKRMGQDKALLNYHGKPQVEFAYQLLKPFCREVLISIRPDQAQQAHYTQFPQLNDLPQYSNMGPLGGIASALTLCPDRAWLVLACDLPFVSTKTIAYLLANRDPQKMATAFISAHDQLPEPLCAVWEPQGLSIIEQFLKEGIQCPRKILLKSSHAHLLPLPDPVWLDNVNSPEEYQQAAQRVVDTKY